MSRLWVLGLVCLTACMTPYQYKGLRGGYTSYAAGNGVFYVSYDGNGYTPASTITSYWLRRAGEVCGGPNSYRILSVQGNVEQSQIGDDKYVISGNTIRHEAPIVVSKHSVAGYVRCLEPEVEAPVAAAVVLEASEPVSKPFEDVWQYTEGFDETGAPPVEVHPYLFLGTLASSTLLECAPRFARTFAGVKDLGFDGAFCEFETKRAEDGVHWTASCVQGEAVKGRSLLIGDNERLREGSDVPSREAIYVEGHTPAGSSLTGLCTYNGFVWKRRAPSGLIVQ